MVREYGKFVFIMNDYGTEDFISGFGVYLFERRDRHMVPELGWCEVISGTAH
jgi:hypothetical protein